MKTHEWNAHQTRLGQMRRGIVILALMGCTSVHMEADAGSDATGFDAGNVERSDAPVACAIQCVEGCEPEPCLAVGHVCVEGRVRFYPFREGLCPECLASTSDG